MNFDHPAILLFALDSAAGCGLMIYAQRKRAAAARRFVEASMLDAADAAAIRRRGRGSKGSFVLLGLAAIIVACARPRFGVYFEKVVQRGVDCFICLDVSRSMLAEDVAPNRLERAKSDIRDLLKKLAGDHVGLDRLCRQAGGQGSADDRRRISSARCSTR